MRSSGPWRNDLREREPDAPALRRYAEVAALLTGRPGATVEDGVAWLRATVGALDVPPLGTVGLDRARHAEVAEKAAKASSMRANPVQLDADELVTVMAAGS